MAEQPALTRVPVVTAVGSEACDGVEVAVAFLAGPAASLVNAAVVLVAADLIGIMLLVATCTSFWWRRSWFWISSL